MKFRIEYSSFVKQDLKEITDWYKEVNRKLTPKFMKEYRSKIKYISENPLSSEIKYGKNRITFLKKFSFGIHYSYSETEKLIIIYSVFHTSRNPKNWKKRD